MKNKLLREKINFLLVIITSYSIFCLSILNASAQTLGSAHRDYVNSTNSNASNNNPDQLADTGLEDWPWIIIAICAISTVFAYKKIKEYKEN